MHHAPYVYTMEKAMSSMRIKFNKKDETLSHYEDPLLITLIIKSYDVFLIVIDTGTLVDFLFHSSVRALGVK